MSTSEDGAEIRISRVFVLLDLGIVSKVLRRPPKARACDLSWHLVHLSCYLHTGLGFFFSFSFLNYDDELLPLKLLVVMPWLVLLI